MEILQGIESLSHSYPRTVLTIGNFDGLHLGHQKVISSVMREAAAIQGTSVVMTFEPHPAKVLAPERNVRLLATSDEKARLLGLMGVDVLLFMKFDKEFSRMEPEDFIKQILVDRLAVSEVIIGSNYAFGKGKKGTIDLLRRRGKKYGFKVSAIRHAVVNGRIVSSSAIRELLVRGAVKEAAKYLGRAYSIEGSVVKGKGRGRRLLNIPTANITTPVEIAPKEGVYAVSVLFDDMTLDGVANIGKNPTFGNSEVSYEVHILDFDRNLLGENLRLNFIGRIRGERTFPDVSSLEKQIRDDIAKAREILDHSS